VKKSKFKCYLFKNLNKQLNPQALSQVGLTLESGGMEKMKTLHVIAEHEHFPKSAPCWLTP
jgi:hypothetical protein